MKKLFFLGACLVALASQPVKAQTGGAEVVTVRVVESARRARLWINWVGQEPEFIEFDTVEKAGKTPNTGTGYQAALSKLYQRGYQMQGVIPGAQFGNPVVDVYSTLVFSKPAAGTK